MDCPLSRMSPHLLANLQAPPTPEDLVQAPCLGLEEFADDFLDEYSLMGACGRGWVVPGERRAGGRGLGAGLAGRTQH